MDQEDSGYLRRGEQEEDLRLADLKDLEECRQGGQEEDHGSMVCGVPGDQDGQGKKMIQDLRSTWFLTAVEEQLKKV